jgi:hypothetical protein
LSRSSRPAFRRAFFFAPDGKTLSAAFAALADVTD